MVRTTRMEILGGAVHECLHSGTGEISCVRGCPGTTPGRLHSLQWPCAAESLAGALQHFTYFIIGDFVLRPLHETLIHIAAVISQQVSGPG